MRSWFLLLPRRLWPFAGCKGSNKESADSGTKRVVTTFTIIADMAREVAGDAAIVESITKPGAEIHGYDPTPKDIVKAQKADLVLWNGMNLELWFEKFFQNVRNVPECRVHRGHHADGDHRGAVHREAQSPQPGCRPPMQRSTSRTSARRW